MIQQTKTIKIYDLNVLLVHIWIFSLGDDQSVSIQMRGGPEPMMVTSWAQIMSLDPSYIGIYHCIATNNMGSVAAFADVGVYNNEL